VQLVLNSLNAFDWPISVKEESGRASPGHDHLAYQSAIISRGTFDTTLACIAW
jgi:anti-sigma factor ChrR (cupin superfamily)